MDCKNVILDFESKPVDETLQEAYWKYYLDHDSAIPISVMGAMLGSIRWMAQYSDFYYDGGWPNKSHEDYKLYYNGIWQDILSRKQKTEDVFDKYFSSQMTTRLSNKIKEVIEIAKLFAPEYAQL